MRPIQNVDGKVRLGGHEYEIATTGSIKAGQVVKLSNSKVISAIAAETGAILGIAMETHSGSADALNARANGTKIMVYDNPGLIFECPVPTFTATGGSATTVTVTCGSAAGNIVCDTADIFNNGKVALVKKASGSTNTDTIGKVRAITDYAVASAVGTLTVESAGTAVSGDEYAIYPPIGAACAWGALDATDFSKIVLTAEGLTKIKVVGHDYERGMLRLMAVEHALGVEN